MVESLVVLTDLPITGNSAIVTFFGMVSLREHFKGCNGDLQRTGIKLGHGLNHLVIVQIVWVGKILLMAEILHQLIGSLSYYLQGFITYTSQVVGNGISEASTVSSQNGGERWR